MDLVHITHKLKIEHDQIVKLQHWHTCNCCKKYRDIQETKWTLEKDIRHLLYRYVFTHLTLLYMFPTVLQTDEYIWPSVSLNPAQPMSTRGWISMIQSFIFSMYLNSSFRYFVILILLSCFLLFAFGLIYIFMLSYYGKLLIVIT